MRVNDAAASQRSAESAAAVRFGDALRRARADAAARGGRTNPDAASRREARRPAMARAREVAMTKREDAMARPEEERVGAAADPIRAGGPGEISPVPEIAALVRTLPVAIAAARTGDGAPLALSFGRSLEVELRAGAAGVEVLLRPEPRLLRAAEAELPRVLAALRLRGVAVARAEVRARGGCGGTRRAR